MVYNIPPAGKGKDCHDQEITGSKHTKNVIDGVDGLTNLIWDKRIIKPAERSCTLCRKYKEENLSGNYKFNCLWK